MLRHAAGSALTAAGGLDVAQAILGHASITSTQIYVHASAERQRDAVERLSRARSQQAGAPR
jgi:site-specific recombinase XerD